MSWQHRARGTGRTRGRARHRGEAHGRLDTHGRGSGDAMRLRGRPDREVAGVPGRAEQAALSVPGIRRAPARSGQGSRAGIASRWRGPIRAASATRPALRSAAFRRSAIGSGSRRLPTKRCFPTTASGLRPARMTPCLPPSPRRYSGPPVQRRPTWRDARLEIVAPKA